MVAEALSSVYLARRVLTVSYRGAKAQNQDQGKGCWRLSSALQDMERPSLAEPPSCERGLLGKEAGNNHPQSV